MATVNDQGTRVFNAPAGQAWIALAPGADPDVNYTEVTRIIKADVDVLMVDEYDDAPLAATVRDMQMDIKPGSISFSKDKVTIETILLRALCDGITQKRWVILYKDGSADVLDGKLIPVKGASAQRGDYKKHISEDYKVQGLDTVTHEPAA